MKNNLEIIYGTDRETQAVLVTHGGIVTDAFYASAHKPNLAGLVATAKVTETSAFGVFATLPNGARGWLETKQKPKAGDIIQARVSAYVTGNKAWPLKLAGNASLTPAPSLLERITSLLPLSVVREDSETIAEWLHGRKPVISLADGANIVIGSTAALTAIDLNAGRQKNTAQLIAAFGPAVADVIRHYQLGGAIVVDAGFMAPAARRGLADKIKKHLASDPLKAKVISTTKMGLIEITRPRIGPSMLEIGSLL